MTEFYIITASNAEELHDPSEEALAELLRRLGRTTGVHLQTRPVGDDSRWDLRVRVFSESGCYWLFWRDFLLGRHSTFESDDPIEVAHTITDLVRLSADARK